MTKKDLPFIFSTGLYVLTWLRSHFKSLSIHCLSLLTSLPPACTEALIPPMCWCEVVHAHQRMQSQGKCHQLEQNIYCHCGLKQKESASLVLHEPSPPVLRCSLCRQLLHSPYHCRSHRPGWGHSVWRPLDKGRTFERCCVCLFVYKTGILPHSECSQPLRISCRCFLLKTDPHGLDGLVMIRQEVLSSIRLSMCCRSTSHDFSGCENNHNTYLCTITLLVYYFHATFTLVTLQITCS